MLSEEEIKSLKQDRADRYCIVSAIDHLRGLQKILDDRIKIAKLKCQTSRQGHLFEKDKKIERGKTCIYCGEYNSRL